uniref:Transport system permease protein (ABC.FEV.P) n=1 Tax=uncultured marine thaumarchaeote KM3_54_G03 TaxID=1456192 RepID=A0A075H6U1_9ARCH|nr:transport system permease protein (ABC.FEV.P) [uncultured marine thaumarchaeote KM3_54_G03]
MDDRKHYYFLIAILTLLVAIFFTFSVLVGTTGARLSDIFTTIGQHDSEISSLIIREIRLPRAILGLLIGATLGLAGATLQGYLRNPLAEPGVIGVSTAAALGAVLAIYTGLSLVAPLALPLMAIGGSLIVVLLLQTLAGAGSVLTLILAGVAISSLCGALTSLALNLSDNPFASLEIVFWLLGSITDRSMSHVWLAAPFILTGWLLLIASARALDALSLGEEVALSLGVNVKQTRLLVVSGTAISVGACTAVSGVIGFIGLVVPHLLRPLVGHHPSRLLLASALAGASLLLCADILVRIVNSSTELKLGVVTALIGGPFFLFLIFRLKAYYGT